MEPKQVGRLDKDKVLFFQCDVQEKFKERIYSMQAVVDVCIMMAQASTVFKAPLVETEQYVKALGKTL
jgi:tellurite resistance protein